ncbi:circumsporozoite protein, partial [Apostichopus japonicus]
MPNVSSTGRDKVGSTSQTSVELQMAVSSEENYQSQVKMKDIASVAVIENSSVRFGKSVDSEKTLTGDKSNGSSALVPETPRERTGVIGTGITGSDGSNRNMSAIAKTPCVESVSRVVGREKVICRKEMSGDSRESTTATVPQVSMRHVINTPKEAGISSKKDKNHGGSENKQPTITDGLSASARARVDLSANRKDLQGSGVRTATSRNSSAASNAGLIENNLSTIQSLSVSADKSFYTVSGGSQAPSHEVPTHCSPDLGKDKEPLATEGSSLRMSDVSQQKPQSGIYSANSSRQGNVPKHSSRGDADSVSSDKPSSSNAPLCGKTTNVPSATCKLITAYIRDKSLGNKSSDNNILIPDLIQKHVEKLQRYRSAQPNLTSARVQHHPSQHLDLALSDLKHVLLHLFEQPVSNHRKKLQEAQLKKLFANASKTSERFKRFGVHLESLDPDDSEMIKMLERLTEEDLELLSKEDSKEDLQELLSLFELAEEPPPSSGNSQATEDCTDSGQMRHGVIGKGSSTDAERRKDPETTSPARGGSTSDDSSSDVELIQSVQMEIVVSSESEEEEDEVTKLPTLPTLPTSQNVPSEEADNSLHGQVFQLSLKETEFQQQLKAIRKEQKVLEERIKCDTAKVVSLKKTKVEMKKKMKLLRKNRLKLTKGHTTLPQPAINTVVEGGSFLASSRNSLIDMAVAGAQQQNESSIRSMPLTSQEVLLPHSGSGSVLTPTQIMTAGNVHMIHQASPSSHDPTVPRDLDASNTSVSQAPNQMFKQFTIPPSAMGISIQRLSNEDLLMLARQDLLNSAQTSQVPSSFMFGVAPSAQITSNAMAASSDQSGLETPQLIEGLRPQGVGTGPVGSLGVEKVNKLGLGNAQRPSLGVTNLSQTPKAIGRGNAQQPSQKVGTMSQTPNAVGPGNALQRSQKVGTMSQTPNVVGPGNALQPSQRVGTMSQTPNAVGPVNALQPSQREGTMSQTPNSVGPGNALQRSQKVGTMSQTPNVVGPGNALQPSQRVGTMSQTPNAVGPVNALQPSQREGTMSQTPNVGGPANVLQPSQKVGTMSQTPNVVGPGNALQPSQRVGTMSQTPNAVGPGNALQPSQRVGTMSQTPNVVGPGNALQSSKGVGTMSQTLNAVGPVNVLQPSKEVDTLSQTPNVVGPGNALQPSQREGTMSQTPNVVGPVNALQSSQRVGTVSQTPNAVRLRNAQQPSQVVATHSHAHKAEGPGNAQQPSQGIGSLIPLTLTPQVTSSSSYGGQLPVTSSRENALAQSVPGSLAVDIPYPVSISKVMPTATSLEANPPQMLQEEGHQGVIIKTEPEADHLVETERSEERPQPSSEHGMTASTRSLSDQIPARSSSNQPTPV